MAYAVRLSMWSGLRFIQNRYVSLNMDTNVWGSRERRPSIYR